MKPTRILFVSFLLLCLLPALAAAQTFTDALGREVTLDAPPRRIVAFEGSLAEAVLACGGTLAGTTEDAVSERGLALEQDTAVIGTVKDLGFHPFKLLYAVRFEMKARKTAEEHIDSGDADMNIWDQVATTKKL